MATHDNKKTVWKNNEQILHQNKAKIKLKAKSHAKTISAKYV